MNQIPKQMGVSVFFSLQLIVLLSLLTVITHGLSLKNIPIQSNHQQKDRNHPILCKDITIGVPKELAVNEKRVGLTPESVYRLKTAGYSIVIEEGAGVLSQYLDSDYIQAGASVVKSRHLWDKAGIVVKVQPPSYYETNHLDSKALFCLMGNDFAQSKGLIDRFILQQSTVFAMDRAPRDRPQSRVVDATFSQVMSIDLSLSFSLSLSYKSLNIL